MTTCVDNRLGVRLSVTARALPKAGTYHHVLLGSLVWNEEQHRRLWTMIRSEDERESMGVFPERASPGHETGITVSQERVAPPPDGSGRGESGTDLVPGIRLSVCILGLVHRICRYAVLERRQERWKWISRERCLRLHLN